MPRKTTTLVTCSYHGCKDHGEVSDPTAEAPKGWYMVLLAAPDAKHGFSYNRSGAFEFSSLNCVEKWARERRRYINAGRLEPPARVPNSKLAERALAVLQELGEPTLLSDLAELVGSSGNGIKNALLPDYEKAGWIEWTPGGPGKSAVVTPGPMMRKARDSVFVHNT